MARRLHVGPAGGNGLCVVHDADDLDDATMLAIARETQQSETTFVQAPTTAGADYRNRIFTTRAELPFAGHPSLGTAVAVARARGEVRARYVQETQAGLQPVDVVLDGPRARASMLQEPAVAGEEPGAARVLETVGLGPENGHAAWSPQVVSTGVAQLIAPLRDAAALARCAPDRERLPALLDGMGAVCLYLAVVDEAAGTAQARSFFVGETGVLEDPATGSAVGPLMAYLAARTGLTRLTVAQGAAIRRPSTLEASMEGDVVRVAGDAVVIAEGRSLL